MARPPKPATPDDALRQIASQCRADLLKHRAVVLRSRRATGIHQTRVVLRRLRAALGLFHDSIGSADTTRFLAGEARWLAGECAPARDLHVFLTETVRDVPPLIRRVANRLARINLERARAALSGERYAAFDRALAALAETPAATTASVDLTTFSRAVLERRHAKVAHRGRRLESLDDDRLHRLRIAAKKLRYAATFLRRGFASRAANAYIETTVRLQGALGALNDRAVAGRTIADIAAAARPTEDVERSLRKLGKQAAAGDKRRRRKLQLAWAAFRKAERFW